MFRKLRPSGRPGEPAKGGTGASQDRAETPAARAEPPRIELPRHRPTPPMGVPGGSSMGAPDRAGPHKPPHLKSVDPARPPSRSPAQPIARPAAPQVAQPIYPAQPARPVIPPYPVPGARAGTPTPAAGPSSGAEVQGLGRLMLVGPQVRLSGEIKACERLVVEGLVEGEVSETERLEVARGGRFRGAAQVESCMLDGIFEGELEVRGVLTLKPNGRVAGTVRYGEIEIERGGVIAGNFGTRGAAEGTSPAAGAQAGRPQSGRPQSALSLKAGGPRPA